MRIARHQADTSGPRLASRAGAWTYDDPAVHVRALRLDEEHGVNLAEIDDWIEGENWADAENLQRVLAWRERLLNASSDDAAEGWGMFLLTLAALNVRERFLHRLALIGRWVEPRLGGKPPGARVTLRVPRLTTMQRAARNKRIATMASDGVPVAEISRKEKLGTRQVRRIIEVHSG